MAKRGWCFRARGKHTRHVHIILTHPDLNKQVVVANMTTWRGRGPVVLQAGDHSFVTHDTTIAFERAAFMSAAALDAQLARGGYERMDDLAEELVDAVISSLIASDVTPQHIRDTLTGIAK